MEKFTIKQASNKTNIKETTAKIILASFKKTGQVGKKTKRNRNKSSKSQVDMNIHINNIKINDIQLLN